MKKAKVFYNEKHKEVLDSFLLMKPEVSAGKMFGFPAYYVHGKLFACVYEDGVGIKIPEEMAQQLLKTKRVIPFQPFGKAKMREWVQINHERSKDYLKDREILFKALEFVSKAENHG